MSSSSLRVQASPGPWLLCGCLLLTFGAASVTHPILLPHQLLVWGTGSAYLRGALGLSAAHRGRRGGGCWASPRVGRAVGCTMTRGHFLCPCRPHGHPVRQGLTDLFTGWGMEARRGHLACSMTVSKSRAGTR